MSHWKQNHPSSSFPAASSWSGQRCPPGCVPAPRPRCPPGCVPAPQACPPGYRRVERLFECRPVRRHQRLSPRLSQIIDNQLRKISEGQQRQLLQQQSNLQRTQSEIAISPNQFALASPQAASANASGYALSHSASISASVEQLPDAIREV